MLTRGERDGCRRSRNRSALQGFNAAVPLGRIAPARYMPPPPPPPPPPSPPLSCIFSGTYGAWAWPPWAHAASASITKSAMSHLRQFIASSGQPDPPCLTRASDRLDQALVIVLDVADPRADGPGDHLLRRVRREQGFELRRLGGLLAKPRRPPIRL